MIVEVAVEPEIMAHWNHFQSLHADFGVGQGRLLCEFPEKWREIVLQRAAELEQLGINSPRQALMLLDQLDPLKKGPFMRALIPAGRKYSGKLDWCNAARSTNPTFDVVIHGSKPQSPTEVTVGEFLKTSAPYATQRQIEIPRKAEALIDCGWTCFRQAKEIYVVDPYFRPLDQQFGLVLGKFLTRVERNGVKPTRIEVHTKLPEVYKPNVQQGNWKHWAESHLPIGWTLKVVHWKTLETGSQMHARYILTDFGGLDYNWGTDEDPREFTQVGLLDDLFWQELYKRFSWTPESTPKVFRNHPDRIFEVNG
jgi:hypothetical protein